MPFRLSPAAARQAWVADLRSGAHTQVRNRLCLLNEDQSVAGHCVLGVACETFQRLESPLTTSVVRTLLDYDANRFGYCRSYDDCSVLLPYDVAEWLDLTTRSGAYGTHRSLYEDNDAGVSFERLASVIEAAPCGLFVDSTDLDRAAP